LLTVIRRRNLLIAGALVLVGIILSIGTHDYAALLSGALVFAFMAFSLWFRIRRRGSDG
jgi:hypothetical protein